MGSVPLPGQLKKRHKSFAGCWTCRARKVKCDESRPRCVQCRLKDLDCEGYAVRLRWMPLEAGSDASRDDDNQSQQGSDQPGMAIGRSQRSLIVYEDAQSHLSPLDLDDIFRQIDGFPVQKQRSSANTDHALFLTNFGVFLPCPGSNEASSPLPSSDEHQRILSQSLLDAWPPDDAQALDGTGPRGSELELNGSAILSPGHGQSLSPSTIATLQHGTATDYPAEHGEGDHLDGGASPGNIHGLWWTDDSSNAITYNPSPSYMPEVERFLMNHYVHRVVHLFCVTDYEKSPWKTIHLPRVLQSAGQLSLYGSTSKIRDALRNALLSISAFYLANDSNSRSCEKEAGTWANDAIKFKGRAIKLLKETVESSTPHSRPKYKELLATMLSMITINVMSGDTSTCGIHLDGAFRFMTHIRGSKTKYSSKAQSLHRIYFYLRVIYDSTAARHNSLDQQSSSCSPASPDSYFGTALSVGLLDRGDETDGQRGNSPLLCHVAAPRSTTVGEYEYVYGVPQDLLILLARTTDLIEQIDECRKSGSTPSHELAELCNELESDIMEWVPGYPFPSPQGDRGDGSRTTPSSEIIEKTTAAFHNALVIYFAQHIRLMRHSFLRSHIEIVLGSIEDIERIKADSGILSAPLYWPAFIAGSEAFDSKCQDRFRAWYAQVEAYRLASVRSGIGVLKQVWAEGPTPPHNRTTSQWRTAVRRTGACLMLS
ncbi:fungal-specific transcription factor domain-containing protein [Microdochium trichocladiopsis]|uniref:Fungal-specific transcription factor domain-containing protein n=1 Tax=Microdochium trichocladiopsis TaxID=1682393 RepID=A0A9P8YCY6_9PEZI|nr:fungal-specific transcription factor domain-containing protein [Microdochium trichocladiopsis]KAH7034527.1 fungal-specific transcription factor domain-containing protein [Microdochium trichocladiopsis]